MPWFDPPSTPAEDESWIHPGGPGVKHKVGRWPSPDVNRSDAGFILRYTKFLAHIAHKRLFCWDTGASFDPVAFPPWSQFGWLDLIWFSEGKILNNTGENSFGWASFTEINEYSSLPQLAVEGVEFKMKLNHGSSGHFITVTKEFPNGPFAWQWDTDARTEAGPWTTTTKSIDFPYIATKWFDYAISDCFTFPRAPPAPVDFAELNAVDSDVIFDKVTVANGPRYYLEFDIRNHEDTSIVVLGKTFNTTQYFGFNGQWAFWNGYLTDMGEILTLETWIHIRFEWAWIATDSTYRCYWDGLPKGTKVGALRTNTFNTIGKKGPAFVGHFDLKNLFYATGEPGAEVTLLDMPLQVDACDVGPDLIKGTTTNMTLASCP